MKITATIITLNEADNIREACESVAWADEILKMIKRALHFKPEV